MYNYPQKREKLDENGLFLSYYYVSLECLVLKKVSSNPRQKERTLCCFKIPLDAGYVRVCVPLSRMSGNHLFEKKTQVCVCVTFACALMACGAAFGDTMGRRKS